MMTDVGTNAAMVDAYSKTMKELGNQGKISADDLARLRNAVDEYNSLTGAAVEITNEQTGALSLMPAQIDAIKKQIGITPKAEYVYCLIYLGFRPSEFLALNIENYDSARQCFTGGGKTEAGSNRTVTISPKIQPYINKIAADRTEGAFFCTDSGKAYSLQDFTEKVFYPVLTAAGIDNPMVEISGGIERHKYTPHSCRHTFATLLKNVQASDKDKLELIGHTSDEMLRYYQDVKVEDLRKITDNL
jgi:integrase